MATDQAACGYENGCLKNCEGCRLGQQLKQIDKYSVIEVVTPEDMEQSKILAALEAEKNIIA